MAESNEAIVSMADVLEEQDALEDEVNAVLGASDDKQCTYLQGYVKRQALYACVTCKKETGSLAGVCLACSLHCHDSHDLVELYTKRNFRCDCGNSKFPDFQCKLIPEKDETNPQNNYNHNFKGVYCSCNRPYPDPEAEEEVEMIQCILCEDWFHSTHLEGPVPDCDDYHELICSSCMKKHPFLYAYLRKTRFNIEEDVDILSPSKKAKLDEDEESTKSKVLTCKLALFKAKVGDKCFPKGPGCFDDDWRSSLCTCKECKELFEKEGLSFLLDDEDSTSFYEACGKLSGQGKSSVDVGLEAVQSQFSAIQQIEMFSHFNSLKGQLTEYLKDFADTNKVVTKEDIEHFFEKLKETKAKTNSSAGIPPARCT